MNVMTGIVRLRLPELLTRTNRVYLLYFSKVSSATGGNLEMTIGDTLETALAETKYALTPDDKNSDGNMNGIEKHRVLWQMIMSVGKCIPRLLMMYTLTLVRWYTAEICLRDMLSRALP